MNIPSSIIDDQSPRVRQLFIHWAGYMEACVEFWEIPGNIDIHTQGHCERVLLHALRIGHQRGMNERSLAALAHAAIFHDTRRKDNYLDVGHGGRAAQYYRTYCHGGSLDFLGEAYESIKYHDRDDDLGNRLILRKGGDRARQWLELYHVFKDADDGVEKARKQAAKIERQRARMARKNASVFKNGPSNKEKAVA